MPFGGDCEFANFEACVKANQDKDSPEGYCAALMEATEEHCKEEADKAKHKDRRKKSVKSVRVISRGRAGGLIVKQEDLSESDRAALAEAMGRECTHCGEEEEAPGPDAQQFGVAVMTKAEDKRYTFGVVYVATNDADTPQLDTHEEFALADDLQEAQWEYVRQGNRNIYLQHGDASTVIGEVVDIVSWPYEVEAEFLVKGVAQKQAIPANSVWMGVIWAEEAWPLVKSGKIGGLSMGGWARRLGR